MNDDLDLRHRNEELERRLSVAEQMVLALASGQLDSVAAGEGGTPLLLRVAQAKLREREQILRAIFDSALDAMLLCDDRGRSVDANPAACKLFGLAYHSLLGRSIAELAAPGYAPAVEWNAFLAQGSLRGDFPLLRPDGERRELEFSAVANVIPGLHLSVLRDVTERKQADEELRKSQYFLEAAQQVAQVGGWVVPLVDGPPCYWTQETYRIAGVPNGSPVTFQSFLDLVQAG
ncbi:MAG: histidine kinase [Labilithrix sp.]|nr:histidine kinase [Labilithrix sp.]